MSSNQYLGTLCRFFLQERRRRFSRPERESAIQSLRPVKATLRLLPLITAFFMLSGDARSAESGLQVFYGANGIEKLSFNGVVLQNLSLNSAGAFHIWHMKVTDQSGQLLRGSQYDWGENNNGKLWDAATHTWSYKFNWGSISLQYVQSGNTLNMNVAATNLAGSKIVFDGAAIYPLVLQFPSLPRNFKDPSYQQLAFNTTAPSVTLADYGQGEVAVVYPSAVQPLYSGFAPAEPKGAYTSIISGTSLEGMPTFFPRNDRPLTPGRTDTYTVSLRFARSGTPVTDLAADVYKNWAKTWPPVLEWNDRRVIGTVYLASSPAGNPSVAGGFPNNPRRYFNDGNAENFDVESPSGLTKFQRRVLRQAATNVENLKRLNSQGAITWDIEGEQYPQTTSYVCAPDAIAQESPEMESVVSDRGSPYHGMKLDDAYFKIMRDAGFRVGVCVRPQHFEKHPDGSASQMHLPDTQVAAELIHKMTYAHDRWKTTLFYIDSTVDSNGTPLDASIIQQVAAAFPDSLLIPEESTPKYYAYAAPFATFIFHNDLGTPPDVHSYYPNAFSANMINDVDSAKLADYRSQLIDSISHGDLLLVHADYWQANNAAVLRMYQEAKRAANNTGEFGKNK